MKFYRRHKHELHHEDGDDPLPAPPEKKMRYSRADDILLAQHFLHKPEGTSDKIFQSFARLVGCYGSAPGPAFIIFALAPSSSMEGVAGTLPNSQGQN
jgi:hypothetical protein